MRGGASAAKDTARAPAPVRAPSGFALWNLGFRPFYLLASIFAAVSILLWIAEYSGYLPAGYLRDPVWHAHEMLFGYTMAVVAGFLFTAVRNWTGQSTPTGAWLAAYTALWIAGRIVGVLSHPVVAAWVNAAFPLAVAVGIAVPLVRSGNRRNYFFIALLVALAIATLAVHLARLRIVAWPERASLQVGLDIVLLIVAVMAGRVIPMFTNNGIPGLQARRNPLVERWALAGIVALGFADLFQLQPAVIALLALVVAVAHGVRLWLWQPWRTASAPLVWSLHAAYAWIVIHLGLRALVEWDYVAAPLGTHALTIGVIGGMTIAMMARTARGHSGRPLSADAWDVACFMLVQLAALTRVFGGLVIPEAYRATVVISGVCWSSAFALYAVHYWPMLTRPRLDGKPG